MKPKIEVVERYRTEDGTVFRTMKQAIEHNREIAVQKTLFNFLVKKNLPCEESKALSVFITEFWDEIKELIEDVEYSIK